MDCEPFGRLPSGESVETWTIGRGGGPIARILTYGARLASLVVPVADGAREVTLGHPELTGYVGDTAYLGAIVGRYANRLREGRFQLDGQPVQISLGGRAHALHGGAVGFDRAVWRADSDGEGLILRHASADGDQGFPGRLDVTVRYAIEGGALVIDYMATADATTVLNLTNHAYFNLDGFAPGPRGDILGHELTLHADRFTGVDAGLVPTGELLPVEGTPLDFRAARQIGERIDADYEQLILAGGYDHNFVLSDAQTQLRAAARLTAGGLVMDVLTTEPGIQFYSGNFLPESGFAHRRALCLETQHFPDSPNQPTFPSTVLRSGDTFRSRTVYKFTAS